jgi:hypothetical protein
MSLLRWPPNRLTMLEPTLGIQMCEQCWNKKHPRNGCKIPACQCGCYHGRNKGLSKPRKRAKDCEENQSFPDVGSFTL